MKIHPTRPATGPIVGITYTALIRSNPRAHAAAIREGAVGRFGHASRGDRPRSPTNKAHRAQGTARHCVTRTVASNSWAAALAATWSGAAAHARSPPTTEFFRHDLQSFARAFEA